MAQYTVFYKDDSEKEIQQAYMESAKIQTL